MIGCASVSQSRFRLHIPERCPDCQQVGGIKLEQTIKGADVDLNWCCGACNHSWPVKDGEVDTVERRSGEPDHRQTPRADRRAARPK